MATFEFTVPGKCVAKGRPRFRKYHNFVTTYTPPETKRYEQEVLKAFNKKYRGKKLEGAIKAEICVIFEPPTSTSKKQKEEMLKGNVPYTKKADLDNYIKSLADSINGVAYDDDSAIDEIHAYKMYGPVSCTQIRLTDKKHVIKPFWFIKEEENK